MFKFRELLAAGAFVQRINTTASSFTGIDVSSAAVLRGPVTLNDALTGNAQLRGFITINSGTTVGSVAATGVVSGDIIQTTIMQYASGVASQQVVNTFVASVRTGAFEVMCVGSVAPVGNMPVGWFKIA